MKPAGGKLTCLWFFVRLILLITIIQLLWALVLSYGQFISSTEAFITPFDFCPGGHGGVLPCNDYKTDLDLDYDASRVESNILRVIVILCLYTPLVLVPFGLMALQFAVYCEEVERGLLWFSVASQAVSSLLILLGITLFMARHWAYVNLVDMTTEFYICVCVCVELATATGLTWMSGRRLVSSEEKSEHVENYY